MTALKFRTLQAARNSFWRGGVFAACLATWGLCAGLVSPGVVLFASATVAVAISPSEAQAGGRLFHSTVSSHRPYKKYRHSRHRHHKRRTRIGVHLGFGYWGLGLGPGYWYDPWRDPWWRLRTPTRVVVESPPVYIERSTHSATVVSPAEVKPDQAYWHYCPSSRNYYPYVKKCKEAWLKVLPSAPGK